MPYNALLFFIRVRGVFLDSRKISAGFLVLWLLTLSALSEPFGFQASHIGPTPYCIVVNVSKFTSIGFITVTLFDTSVFVGITLRMLSFSFENTWRGRLKMFLSGKGMGHVSRALLQTGQLYYLVTVWVNIVMTIVLLTSLISPTFQGMLIIPNIALQNAMACRVFRLLKLGLIQEDASIVISSMRSLAFRPTKRPNTTFVTTQESTLGAVGEETADIGLAALQTKHDSDEIPSHPPIQISIVQESEMTIDTEKDTAHMV
ncbi:unnamed protein product [Somion occarium]|uniref:Vomeronasal type-1 receptor n=1 Tax=Somion occarium TaxID=3059160 RepID=A0ABP1DJF5_9APHY